MLPLPPWLGVFGVRGGGGVHAHVVCEIGSVGAGADVSVSLVLVLMLLVLLLMFGPGFVGGVGVDVGLVGDVLPGRRC